MPASRQATSADVDERSEELRWLDRCARGDEEAVRWVLRRYRTRVIRLAAHVLRNTRDAEDVAQEAFVKAFRQVGQFRGQVSFYAWLYRIVVNLCLDRLRRKQATSEVFLDDAEHLVGVTDPDIDKRVLVQQLLDTLSPPMRATLVLREIEGLDYAEIAEVLQIPMGTVRSRLNTAREQFRRRWTAIVKETQDV